MTYLLIIILGLFVILGLIGIVKKSGSIFRDKPDQQNPMEGKSVIFVENPEEPLNADGVHGHLVATGETTIRGGFYNRILKRVVDILLSFLGLIIMSPVFLFLSMWILIDDPGPVLFTQKRIGRNKQYFVEHKHLTAYNSLYCKGLKVA